MNCLDPLVGSEGFDVIREFGAIMPMQVIGMMLGIPEADLQKVRELVDGTILLWLEAGLRSLTCR